MSEILSEVMEERNKLEQVVTFLEKRLEKYMTLHDKIKAFPVMSQSDKAWAYDQIVQELKIRE